jgi:integrase
LIIEEGPARIARRGLQGTQDSRRSEKLTGVGPCGGERQEPLLVHPHGLRDTFADKLRAAKMDVGTISKLLGHSSIAVTSRYLDHLTNHQAVTALEGVDLPTLRDL